MQIRPHFFLNAITTIHSMTYKNKNEEIREFIDALSKHLRYMFKGGLIKVPIKEELEHIKNYISMQEIKFPNSVFYIFDVEQGLEQEKIPQFLIHTFVENSFKHAMTLEEALSIFIKIELCKFDGNDTIRIIIEDSGEGFPEIILDKINNIDNSETSGGYQIGISNIKKTLALLYSKNNLLKISNVEPMGGRVEIFIPLEKGD
jgi:LytS/YehU family sensor histidine kinase